jgi:hypothetical protein
MADPIQEQKFCAAILAAGGGFFGIIMVAGIISGRIKTLSRLGNIRIYERQNG